MYKVSEVQSSISNTGNQQMLYEGQIHELTRWGLKKTTCI